MYDFETLVSEVLRNKPELERSRLIELIQEKKKNVGAGYLTDQGALFLIAGELGIQLTRVTSSDLSLKDLYIGASDITVVARVLAIYPISEFKRKDGTTGSYRRVNLFDKDAVTRLTIWDDNQEAMQLTGMTIDSPIRVVSGYVKQGLDGRPNLSVGRRGRIEMVTDQSVASKLVTLQDLVRNVDGVGEGNIVAVEGVSSSGGRSSSFTREDGSQGHMTQFDLAGKDKRMRTVIWNGDELPAIETGERVRVTNLRTRKNAQGELELHGDNGSRVFVVEHRVAASNTLVKVSELESSPTTVNLEVMTLSRATVADVRLRDGEMVRKGELIVGDDSGEVTVVGWRDLAEKLAEVNIGEKIRLIGVTHQKSRMGVEILQLGGASAIERAIS